MRRWFPTRDESSVQIPGTDISMKRCDFEALEPGLVKIETLAEGEIALCSKAYYLKNATEKGKPASKFTCKGGQKERNADRLTWEYYSAALEGGEQISGMNAGFRMGDSHEVPGARAMQTYFGGKTILSPVYTKAVVLDDGVHIRPFTPQEIRSFVAKQEKRAEERVERVKLEFACAESLPGCRSAKHKTAESSEDELSSCEESFSDVD